MEGFHTISKVHTVEQVIEKSRFIGIAVPLTSVKEINEAMQKIRNEYPNARHYVYAYRLYDGFLEKSSDDGEPQGTGGRPVLEILQHRSIWNILVVVVRYFGGILLGTGGLSRAYGGTARILLLESDLQKLTLYQIYTLRVPYEWYELLKYHLSQHDWVIKKEDFNESVSLLIHVPSLDAQSFQKWLGDFTRQQVDCIDRGSVWG